MQDEKEEIIEKNIDFKATIAKFIEADEPELTQEEAIMKYEDETKKKKRKYADEEDGTTEEEEHLRRIKKELLASLERVKKLEEDMYKEKEPMKKREHLKVNKGASNSVKRGLSMEQEEDRDERIQKERE